MKTRPLVYAIPIAALLGTSALVFGFIQKKSQPKTWSSESPNRTYHVSFSGVRSRPSWPFTSASDLQNRNVKITVSRHGTVLVDRAEIYDGDAYDSSFDDLYPKTEWLSETTLHLGQEELRGRPRQIKITNESDQKVPYLYVRAGKTNLFLLFDMSSGTTVTVQADLEHWEDFVGCTGRFDDRDFPYRVIDFSSSPTRRLIGLYNVTVRKDGCSVTAKD